MVNAEPIRPLERSAPVTIDSVPFSRRRFPRGSTTGLAALDRQGFVDDHALGIGAGIDGDDPPRHRGVHRRLDGAVHGAAACHMRRQQTAMLQLVDYEYWLQASNWFAESISSGP